MDVSRKKKDAAELAGRQSEEWQLGQDWARWLVGGNPPQPLTLYGIVLDEGEAAYLRAPLHYARLYGGSGQYRDMQLLWRDLQEVPTIATNYRLMCHLPARGWLSFYYTAVNEFYPDPANWTITFGFENAEPLRLGGLPVPTLAVLTSWCVLGANRWQNEPGIAGLLEAATAPQLPVAQQGEAEGQRKLPRIPGQG
jgi:hypothetical protein